MTKANIRILLADDHGILRAGLSALLSLEPGFEVVGEAADSEEALRLSEILLPDVVLMDISMPVAGGIDATRRMKEKFPEIKVLILTIHEDKSLLQEAVQAGASGYLLKRALKNELIVAIQSVRRGELYIHPGMIRSLLQNSPVEPRSQRLQEKKLYELTPREIDVLRLIAQGYTNSQIAALLSISLRTVEFHRGNITGKLHLQSRVELVRFAAENGLLDFEDSDTVH